jgi:shikimate kinase
LESIYYVLSWACHRRCRHCYETRFRPYVRDALRRVVDEAKEMVSGGGNLFHRFENRRIVAGREEVAVAVSAVLIRVGEHSVSSRRASLTCRLPTTSLRAADR